MNTAPGLTPGIQYNQTSADGAVRGYEETPHSSALLPTGFPFKSTPFFRISQRLTDRPADCSLPGPQICDQHWHGFLRWHYMGKEPPMAPIDEIIQRAAADPTFAQQLSADPIGAARAAGFQISPQELAAFMGLDRKNKSDDEVVEEFQVRLASPGITGTKGGE